MTQYVLKIIMTAIIVVAISEFAKRSSLFGALIASLPLTSLLAMIWLYYETGDTAKIAALTSSIFWFVLPSLVLFVALPILLHKAVPFWPALGISSAMTIAAYFAMLQLLPRFGIEL